MTGGKTWEENLDEAFSNLPINLILATLIVAAAIAYLLHMEIVSLIIVSIPFTVFALTYSVILFLPVSIYLIYRGITRKHREAVRKVEETYELTRKMIEKRSHSTFDKDGNLVKMQ